MGLNRKIGQLLILILALVPTLSWSAISRTQNVAAAAASTSITSTSANDVILVFAYHAGSTTIPSLATNFTNLGSQAGTAQSCRIGYLVSAGGDTSTGTWTNATQVVCFVYRGVEVNNPFINLTFNAGNSATLVYSGFTMTWPRDSWIAAFGGASSATAGMNGNTTNLTNRANVTNANGLDSGGTAPSFGAQTLNVTTSGRWLTATLEVVGPSSTKGFFGWF